MKKTFVCSFKLKDGFSTHCRISRNNLTKKEAIAYAKKKVSENENYDRINDVYEPGEGLDSE